MSARVTVTRAEGFATLTIENGKGNILDCATIAELRAALAALRDDAKLKAVLIEARGPNFSLGASVEEHRPEKVGEMLPKLDALFRELLEFPLPLVAAVRGWCLGGAFELVLCCSLVVAAPDARFGLPEIKLGVFPPLASAILPWKIGLANGERLLLTGEPIDATRAQAIGLLAAIDADPDAAARRLIAEQLLPKSASSLRHAMKAAKMDLLPWLGSLLPRLERYYLDELMATRDAKEGIAAFLEKRPPKWEDG